MADPQPRHWNNSFERVFTVILVLIGLYFFFSIAPILITLTIAIIPILLVAAAVGGAGYILWRCFRR